MLCYYCILCMYVHDDIISDAAHSFASELNTILFALKHINLPGWIVIEDLCRNQLQSFRLLSFLLQAHAVEHNVDLWYSLVFTAHQGRNRQRKLYKNTRTNAMMFVIKLSEKKI
jgi:hypothetical protein